MLVNPFKAVGCAAGLSEPRVSADVVLASSRLRDEGAAVASGRFLAVPGSYKLAGLRIEGFAAPHDRVGGRRFGNGVIWRWRQGGWNLPTWVARRQRSSRKTWCCWGAPMC